jgi:hypothetical protein
MKTPPLLLGAGLLFWGWQAGHLVEGALMAGLLEGAQSVKARWDFTDEDFRRIWTFCALLLLGAALYAFTSAGGPGEFRGFFQNPNLNTERNVGNASARTVAALMRWLPMIFFLFHGRAGVQLPRGRPAGDRLCDPAAPVAKGTEARPDAARRTERGHLLSILHLMPVRG